MSQRFSTSTAGSYTSFYSPEKLFSKIGNVAKKAAIKVVYSALILYYALFDDEVPMTDKMIVVGALGYFILPFDFIPDLLGPIGYTDDGTALMLAAKAIWSNITDKTHRQATTRLKEWFSDVKPSDIQLF